jgi:predicted small lipoprotein YifL
MRHILLVLTFTMAGCDKKQETGPIEIPPPTNAVTGTPKLSGPVTYQLADGEERHQEAPETFEIPAADDRASVAAGDSVKLIFEITDGSRTQVERMWVKVTGIKEGVFEGLLNNDPYCTDELKSGEPLTFEARHIIQIERADETDPEP